MSDAANMFKKLAEGRQKSTPPETEEESKLAPKSNPPEKAKKTTPEPTPEEKPPEPEITTEESTPKRGRPATGKRSDPDC